MLNRAVKDARLKGLHVRSLYVSKRDSMSNSKVCFSQALLLTGLISEVKGSTLRRKAVSAARNHSRPWPLCQTAHPRAKTSRCSGMETTVLWNLKSSSEVTQASQKSILKSTVQPPVQSALNVSGEFFTWSQKVSWNRFRPSCKKSSISFWRRRQSAITISWPVVSSPLWFVPWALPNGVYLLVVNLMDSRHAVRHLAFILTFQTNLKLLVHPW